MHASGFFRYWPCSRPLRRGGSYSRFLYGTLMLFRISIIFASLDCHKTQSCNPAPAKFSLHRAKKNAAHLLKTVSIIAEFRTFSYINAGEGFDSALVYAIGYCHSKKVGITPTEIKGGKQSRGHIRSRPFRTGLPGRPECPDQSADVSCPQPHQRGTGDGGLK